MYKMGKDVQEFWKIKLLQDSKEKFIRFSDFMLKVIPNSGLWVKAREESKRLIELGYGF